MKKKMYKPKKKKKEFFKYSAREKQVTKRRKHQDGFQILHRNICYKDNGTIYSSFSGSKYDSGMVDTAKFVPRVERQKAIILKYGQFILNSEIQTAKSAVKMTNLGMEKS
jgi:hypothetical protein